MINVGSSLLIMCLPLLGYAQAFDFHELDAKLSTLSSDSDRIAYMNEVSFELMAMNPAKGRALAKKGYELAESVGHRKGTARALSLMGSSYWSEGDYSEALRLYFQALDFYVDLSDSLGMAVSYNNIAVAFQQAGDDIKALEYHLLSLNIKKKILPPDNPPIMSFSNIADIYFSMGRLALAEDYEQKALVAARQTNNFRGQAYAWEGLGKIYSARGNIEKAISALEQAYQLREKQGDYRGMASALIELGKVFYSKQDFRESEEKYMKAISFARSSSALDLETQGFQELARLYAADSRYDEAYKAQNNHLALRDSLVNEQKNKELARLQVSFEADAKAQENEELKKENEDRARQIQFQLLVIVGAGVILCLTFLLSIALYRKGRLRKRAQEVLHKKNEQISRQNQEIKQQADQVGQLNEELKALNESLEVKVSERTRQLEEQNHILTEYAFINSHKLRAPLARLMGLVNLLGINKVKPENEDLVGLIDVSAKELEAIVRALSNKLSQDRPMTRKDLE